MSGEFLDTNVLIYAHDTTAGSKRLVARDLIDRLIHSGQGLLSVQVLSEFYVTATRKIPNVIEAKKALEIVEDFITWRVHPPDTEDLIKAIAISMKYGLSFWDAMIIQSAHSLEADIIWSEDLNPGQSYEGIIVRNPFDEI
jgi:predicted nucleic acid-binding protein